MEKKEKKIPVSRSKSAFKERERERKEKEKIIKKMLPRQSSRPSAQQMSLFVFTSFPKALRGTSPVNSNQQFSIEII